MPLPEGLAADMQAVIYLFERAVTALEKLESDGIEVWFNPDNVKQVREEK